MGIMNEVGDLAVGNPADGLSIRQARIIALSGATQVLVAIVDAGDETLAWVRSNQALPPQAVGARCAVEIDPGSRRGSLLGLLDDSENSLPRREAMYGEGPAIRQDADALRIEFGQARIELRRDGSIVLHGTQIASYAKGANKIRGATIELN